MTAQQLSLLSEPRARRTDPATSRVAAAQVDPGPTEADILAVVATLGPLTDDELCGYLPAHYAPTLKSARSRLSKRGALIPTGETRLSLRSRPQQVWRIP